MMDIFIWSTPVLLLIGGLFIAHLSSKSNEKTGELKGKNANKQVKTNKSKSNDDSESVIASAIVLTSNSCKAEGSSSSYDSGSSDSGGSGACD